MLWCACAQQAQPTATPAGALPSPTALSPGSPPITVHAPTAVPQTDSLSSPPAGTRAPSDAAGPKAADLAVEVPASVRVAPGAMTVYTLTIRNHGPDPATGIVFTDLLPEGVVPLWIQPAQPRCERQKRNAGCDLGHLQAGDAATVTLDLSLVATDTAIAGTQPASMIVDLSAPTCEINGDAAQSQVTCRLASLRTGTAAHIRVGITASDPISGSPLHTTTVAADEADPDPSNNRATFALLPGEPEPLSSTSVPTTTDLVLQAGGPLAVVAGQPFTYTYTITNRGALEATGVYFEDVVPSDLNLVAYAPAVPACQQQGDLFTCHLRDLDTGRTVTFTLVITGYGDQPMKLELDQISPGWPVCTVLKEQTWQHIVQCALGTLNPGQAIRVRLVFVAIGVVERTTANTATVQARETERNPLDNTDTTTMTIHVQSDLALSSSISGPAIPGGTFGYTLTVANLGPSDAEDTVLVDTLPAGTTLVSAVPSQGSDCRLEDGTAAGSSRLVCSLDRLNAGETAFINIVVAVDSSLAGPLTHNASVEARPVDPHSANNELAETIPIAPGSDD